ncbi:MAG: bifunctional phosphopantothenoylcysteine decarboxylase/phosphopantothenate--cysteine ligase CoaBC [Cytophagales bacterium]|nr:bifunctional phosphopantothenoylcysteine decarboxylase/phosphopantothenate--cysteine ligase CoaBC [Cytophagales bacterium]
MVFCNKKIIVGVCGSIAAYKTAWLIRLLIKAGAEVQVIMTRAASKFVTPLTLSTLSKKPVLTDFIKSKTGLWNDHVALGLWADAFIVAPASANTLAKLAGGICDNLLNAVYLSARCPVFFAPAMDLDMYQHPSTQNNLKKLTAFRNHIIDPDFGELASGLTGIGRMAEPENIFSFVEQYLNTSKDLKGKKVLITAGPTQEAIDPVRYLSNHSSGKMGFAIAENMADKGASVMLISGPTQLNAKNKNIKLTKVTSADEMYEKALNVFPKIDIAVLAAAVADYAPVNRAENKIRKNNQEITVKMHKTMDTAATLGKNKKSNQIIVGFALETENELEHAQQKLKKKNFDLIVLNSLNDKGAGFGHDTNKITIIHKNNKTREFELKSKEEVAEDIVGEIVKLLNC